MSEREWREAIDERVPRFALVVVLAVAATLRYWALGHGIPHAVGVDEPEIVERSLNMMRSGSLNPHGFFDYPTLSMYIQLLVSIAHFLARAVAGTWSSMGEITSPSFYWWGRATSATFGIATVFVLFQAGLRWGARHALLAAGLLAVVPLHVTYSHYVLTDIPLTFFTTLTLLLALVAAEKNTTRAFVIAGASAGLAASMKYNGGLAILMPIVACWMSRPSGSSRLGRTLLIWLASLVAFVVTSPYVVLDLPGFLNGFARLAGEYRSNASIAEPVWIVYMKHLRLTVGWPALLLAGAGLVLAVDRSVRGPGRVRWAVVLSFTLVYFAIIARQRIVFARYLLPIIPMLCLSASWAVISGVSFLRRYEIRRAPRTALVVALTAAALLPPAVEAVKFDRMIARRGTADQAFDWMQANIPAGATVVLESRKIVPPIGLYNSRNVGTLLFQGYDDYITQGVEYVVASSQIYGASFQAPHEFPAQYAAYMNLFERMKELTRFTPSSEHPGPELRIYRVLP